MGQGTASVYCNGKKHASEGADLGGQAYACLLPCPPGTQVGRVQRKLDAASPSLSAFAVGGNKEKLGSLRKGQPVPGLGWGLHMAKRPGGWRKPEAWSGLRPLTCGVEAAV